MESSVIQNNKPIRNSSIELLRIFSMLMVLCLHGNKDMIMVNDFDMPIYNRAIICVLEALSIVAVNCFILITGYFSVYSNKVKIRKVFDLLFLTSFYGVAIYIGLLAFGFIDFGVKDIIKCAVPYFFDKCWFINIYIVLYVLSPFLNKCLKVLSQKQYLFLLTILLLLFCVWPTFLPNPPSNDNGYGIISFVLMYCIGGYLKLHFNKRLKPASSFGLYLCGSAFTSILFFLKGVKWINYNSVLVVFAAIMLFLTFVNINFNSKFVNYISKSMIAVFIIHVHQIVRPHLFVDIFKLQDHLFSKFYIVYYIFCVLLIFAFCVGIDLLRRLLFKYTLDKWFNKIQIINKTVKI